MRKLSEKEVMIMLNDFMNTTVSGTFCVNRLVTGDYFVWVEKVVKLNELLPETADAFKDLMEGTGAQRLEAICSEKTGKPDRLKVVLVP